MSGFKMKVLSTKEEHLMDVASIHLDITQLNEVDKRLYEKLKGYSGFSKFQADCIIPLGLGNYLIKGSDDVNYLKVHFKKSKYGFGDTVTFDKHQYAVYLVCNKLIAVNATAKEVWINNINYGKKRYAYIQSELELLPADCRCSKVLLDLESLDLYYIASDISCTVDTLGSGFNNDNRLVFKAVNYKYGWRKKVILCHDTQECTVLENTASNVFTRYKGKIIFDCREVIPLREDGELLLLKMVGEGYIVIGSEQLQEGNTFIMHKFKNEHLTPAYRTDKEAIIPTLYKFRGKYMYLDTTEDIYKIAPYVVEKSKGFLK